MPHIRVSQASWTLKNGTLSSYKECTSTKIKKREHGKQNQICLDQSQDSNSLNSVLKPADLSDEYLKLPVASFQLLLHTRAQISKLPHGKCKKSLWIRRKQGSFSTPAITTLTREACLSRSPMFLFSLIWKNACICEVRQVRIASWTGFFLYVFSALLQNSLISPGSGKFAVVFRGKGGDEQEALLSHDVPLSLHFHVSTVCPPGTSPSCAASGTPPEPAQQFQRQESVNPARNWSVKRCNELRQNRAIDTGTNVRRQRAVNSGPALHPPEAGRINLLCCGSTGVTNTPNSGHKPQFSQNPPHFQKAEPAWQSPEQDRAAPQSVSLRDCSAASLLQQPFILPTWQLETIKC